MSLKAITQIQIHLALLILLLFLAIPIHSYAQTTYHVNAATPCTTGCDGTTWAKAFDKLQPAIDAAIEGDEIWVAEGTYYPSKDATGNAAPADNRDKTFYLNKDLTIYGGFPNTGSPMMGDRDWEVHKSTLNGDLSMDDADGLVGEDLQTHATRQDNAYTVVATKNLSEAAIINGFDVQNGNANGEYSFEYRQRNSGGGMYNELSNITLTHCLFYSNSTAESGGGMYSGLSNAVIMECNFSNNFALVGGGVVSRSGTTTLTKCTFSNNISAFNGGGIDIDTGIIESCVFTDNSAGKDGGGISSVGGSNNILVKKCTFSDNSAANWGGAIYFFGGFDTQYHEIDNCSFLRNSAESGGGINVNFNTESSINACIFSNNSATYSGGGINNMSDSKSYVTNSVFSNNSAVNGGGINNSSDCSSYVTNCSFANNSAGTHGGGGIYNQRDGFSDVANCIFWGNGTQIFNGPDGEAAVSNSIVEGGYSEGTIIIDEDPLFIDPTNNDLRISFCSPAIDMGNNAADLDGAESGTETIADISTDLEGNSRIVNETVDMGAYESGAVIEGNLKYCASDNSTNLDAGNWTSYLWSNDSTTPTIEANGGIYTVTITDSHDCTATAEVTVTELADQPSITGNLQYCVSEPFTTLDSGNWTSYKWSTDETSRTIEVSEGTYTVTITNSNGCTGTDEVTVIENENPKPAFNNNTLNENWIVCSEASELKYVLKNEELGSGGNYSNGFDNYATYTWAIQNGSFSENPENKNTSKVYWNAGPETGKILVTVTDANGCQGNTMLSIEVLAPLQPIITGTFDYCRGREATLDAGVYDLAPQTYLWSNGETSQSFSTAEIGVYTVTVTNQEGCTGTAMAEVIATPCLAESGILTTNAATICAGGNVEVSTTNEQINNNYLQYFFLYTQDNLGNTLLQEYTGSNYESGEASASFGGLAAGNYLVCVYNECQDCLPNPSPITTNLDDIYLTGYIQDGCFDIECATITVPEAFEPSMEGSGQVTGTNSSGQNIFIAEICGGTTPYSIDFNSSGGFAAINDYPSSNAGCANYQIVYANGAEWTLTATDANNCTNETVVLSSAGLPSNPLPQIMTVEVGLETCVGDADGSITIEVEGGDGACGNYTYTWSGFNDFNVSVSDLTTGNEVTGLTSGFYHVTITDCAGTTATDDIFVGRKTGRGRGRGGCKTSGGENHNFNENEILTVYPNPFGQETTIELSMAQTSKISLSVYAMDGRKVAAIWKGEPIEGETLYRVTFEADKLPNGLYILELETELGERFYEKLMVEK
ncbi:MAG: T9SS type A sorting domain-containing protein [Chitinophagales bacterium]